MVLSDVIVIGTGFSSAILTRKLAKSGYKVIVIEARNKLGGRTSTINLNDHKIDAGCSFIHGFSETHPLASIAKELGIEITPAQPKESGDLPNVIINSNSLPLDQITQTNIQKSLDAAVNKAKSSNDNITLFNFISHSLKNDLSGDELTIAESLIGSLEAPVGMSLNEVKVFDFGWENSIKGIDAVVKDGYINLLNRIWEDCTATGNVNMHFNHRVVEINTQNSKAIVNTSSGQLEGQFEAKYVVCSIPLAVLQKGTITFTPQLPQNKLDAITQSKVGILEKAIFTYNDYFWRPNLKATNFTILPTRNNDYTSPKAVFESAVLNVQSFPNHPSLLIYLSSTAVKNLRKFDRNDILTAAADVLSNKLGGNNVKPVEAYLTSWLDEPETNGATSTSTPQSLLNVISEPVQNGILGFAGEHCGDHDHGSVNGAVFSGITEANRLINLLK